MGFSHGRLTSWYDDSSWAIDIKGGRRNVVRGKVIIHDGSLRSYDAIRVGSMIGAIVGTFQDHSVSGDRAGSRDQVTCGPVGR